MNKNLVLTVTGPDRIGLVEDITKRMITYDANIEASRMARLGGEFAILMMVSVPEQKFDALREAMRQLPDEGYKISTRETKRGVSTRYVGWNAYRVKVSGADHEGIIHDIAHHLAEQGINIETMDTDVIDAPMSGGSLFTMDAVVYAPPNLKLEVWRDELDEVGDKLNVDTEVSPYSGE